MSLGAAAWRRSARCGGSTLVLRCLAYDDVGFDDGCRNAPCTEKRSETREGVTMFGQRIELFRAFGIPIPIDFSWFSALKMELEEGK